MKSYIAGQDLKTWEGFKVFLLEEINDRSVIQFSFMCRDTYLSLNNLKRMDTKVLFYYFWQENYKKFYILKFIFVCSRNEFHFLRCEKWNSIRLFKILLFNISVYFTSSFQLWRKVWAACNNTQFLIIRGLNKCFFYGSWWHKGINENFWNIFIQEFSSIFLKHIFVFKHFNLF